MRAWHRDTIRQTDRQRVRPRHRQVTSRSQLSCLWTHTKGWWGNHHLGIPWLRRRWFIREPSQGNSFHPTKCGSSGSPVQGSPTPQSFHHCVLSLEWFTFIRPRYVSHLGIVWRTIWGDCFRFLITLWCYQYFKPYTRVWLWICLTLFCPSEEMVSITICFANHLSMLQQLTVY